MFFRKPRSKPPTAMDMLVLEIEFSLRNEPRDWKVENCRAVHKSGVRVWIANRDYGIHIEPDSGSRIDPDESQKMRIWKSFQVWESLNEPVVEELAHTTLKAFRKTK